MDLIEKQSEFKTRINYNFRIDTLIMSEIKVPMYYLGVIIDDNGYEFLSKWMPSGRSRTNFDYDLIPI